MKSKHVLVWVTPAYAPRLNGIARYAKAHGWHLTIADRLGRRPIGWRGDGALTTMRGGNGMASYIRELRRRRIPVVDLSFNHPEVRVPRVSGDHVAMGRLAGEHFRDHNFRNAAWFSTGWLNIHKLRYQGLCEIFTEKPPRWIIEEEIPERQRDDLRVVSKWLGNKLKKAPKPLAVLAYDDADASRVLSAALDAGLSVPEDVAILGIGGDTLICENQPVPLSSVEHNQERTGYEGAALLDRLMNTQSARSTDCEAIAVRPTHEARSTILIPPTGITVRASTDHIAVANPVLHAALIYIKENLSKPIGIDQIADSTGTSRTTLDRLFSAEMGHSAGREILRQRLLLSKSLLKNRTLSLSDIATSCGLCNQAYLTNLFKKHMGTTPTKWRSAHSV